MKSLSFLLLGMLLAVPVYADRAGEGRRHGHGDGPRFARGHGHRGPIHGHSRRYRPYVHRHRPVYHGAWAYRGWPYSRSYYPYHYGRSYTSIGIGFHDDDYSYRSSRGNYATNGLLLGALAGGVIGNNSGDLHHNAWLGAGLGAAAGYIAGSVAENRAQRQEAAEAAATAVSPTLQPSAETSAVSPTSPVEAERPRASTMTAANRLFGR